MSLGIRRQVLFWLLAIGVFFLALYLFRGILLPFVAGMAIAYLLDPLCDRLEAMGLSRTLATVLLTLLALFFVVAALVLLIPAVAGQVAGLLERAPGYIRGLQESLASLIAMIEARADPELMTRIETAASAMVETLIAWTTSALAGLITGGAALLNLLSLLVITPVVAFYLLRDWDHMVARVDRWLPRPQAETIRQQAREVDRTLAGFVRGQASVCALLAIFYALGLTLAGLEFGLVIGLLAGLLTFIPYVGALIGGLLSVGLALVQFDNWMPVAIVAAIFVVGQVLEGNFLTPKLVGDRVGLHPVWIIFALLAGGALFGFLGILLALPVAAVIGVLIRFSLARYLESEAYLGSGAANQGSEAERDVT